MSQFSDIIPSDLSAEIVFVKNHKSIRKLLDEINESIFLGTGEISLNYVGHISDREKPQDYPLPNIHLRFEYVKFHGYPNYWCEYGIRVCCPESGKEFRLLTSAIIDTDTYYEKSMNRKTNFDVNIDELVDGLKLAIKWWFDNDLQVYLKKSFQQELSRSSIKKEKDINPDLENGKGSDLIDDFGLMPLDDGDYIDILSGNRLDPVEAREHRRMMDLDDGIVWDD